MVAVVVAPTAGAVGSPQLLLQSGIGPLSHFREVGVDQLLALAGVGENLHDHPRSTVVYRPAWEMPLGANNHAEVLGLVAAGLPTPPTSNSSCSKCRTTPPRYRPTCPFLVRASPSPSVT